MMLTKQELVVSTLSIAALQKESENYSQLPWLVSQIRSLFFCSYSPENLSRRPPGVERQISGSVS